MHFSGLRARVGDSNRPVSLPWSLGARTPYEREATIDQLYSQRASERPHAIAAVAGGFEITYAELERESNRIANHLRSLGVRRGSAVGVETTRAPELPAALLGILKAGGAYVPLDPAYPRERLASLIEDAAIDFVLAVTDAQRFSGLKAACVKVADSRAASAERLDAGTSATSLAYVAYTSGSTGRPKGVAIEHRGVVRLVRNTNYENVVPGDCILHHAPLAFDASTFEIWAPLLNGARLVIPPAGLLAIDDLAETIDAFGVTTVFLTSALFARFVDATASAPPSLRCIITGGEVLSTRHARRFFEKFQGCRLINAYGPTENTTFSTTHEMSPADAQSASIPIGRPIANSSAYVLDAALQPVPEGATGELCVGGDGVALGYLNAPELTAERFVADPFVADPQARLYRTGDRARFRPDGLLEFLGRADRQVKVRGYRVEPGEIEAALAVHPEVGEAVAVIVERDGEKDIVVHVVALAGAQLDECELRAHLREKLPPYMLPHRIEIRAALPLGPTGKVDRRELERPPLVTPVTVPVARFARSPEGFALEDAVARIWRDVLGLEIGPGLDVNFFDAGGDSLRLLGLRTQLEERLGANVSVTDLFEQTTIRKLAAFLSARKPVLA